ncbi:hypothetical protein RFI_11314 [Reticulomyxa filosa]|uniref:Uncharacterized protein n=1 Tax=Reticulomyxa filosa TaxID=46433 RepID=X6NKD4_RETFI|nr:hypothetical protein RFI_11314 [Reticulomyxa filosa]|eukprot:ETO25822.1 hypothetical protein RFI_11314 [Reticulomyxa filosa]
MVVLSWMYTLQITLTKQLTYRFMPDGPSAHLYEELFNDPTNLCFTKKTWANLFRNTSKEEQEMEVKNFKRGEQTMTYVYYTSLSHGASMLIGAILALDLMELSSIPKDKWSSIIYPYYSTIAFVGLFLSMLYPGYLMAFPWPWSQDTLLDYIWTGTIHKLFAVSCYAFFFIAVAYHNHRPLAGRLSAFACDVLSWRGFAWVQPYTYGIYQFHCTFIFVLLWINCEPKMEWIHFLYAVRDPQTGAVLSWYPKLNVRGDAVYGYSYLCFFTGVIFCLAFTLAFITYWILEYPVEWFRYRYIRPKYTVAKKKQQ